MDCLAGVPFEAGPGYCVLLQEFVDIVVSFKVPGGECLRLCRVTQASSEVLIGRKCELQCVWGMTFSLDCCVSELTVNRPEVFHV